MKPLFLLLAFVLPLSGMADDYYISSSTGNNANPGTISLPWATIKSYSPGNRYFVKAGDVFYNANLPRQNTTAASRIMLSKYGTGPSPIFSSFATIRSSAWSLYSPNVWVATITSSLYVTGTVPKTANCGMIVVNGVKHGFRAGQLTGLNFQWEFYCDFNGGHIYVYSTSNPSLLASWIMVSNDQRPIIPSKYMTIDHIAIEGVSSAPLLVEQPINDTFRYCRVWNCGGEMKSIYDTVRQGAGIAYYNGGTNSMNYADTVGNVYECAYTWQTHASGATPIAYTNCVIRKSVSDSCESSFNPSIAVAGAHGFITCIVDTNTFKFDGYSWSHGVKPVDNQAISLLNNFWQGLSSERGITLQHNVIECPREALYYFSGTATDPRFTTQLNDIYIDPNIRLRKSQNDVYPYVLATHAAFTTASGYEISSTWNACSAVVDTTTIDLNVTYYLDADGDNYGDINNPISSTTGPPAGYVENNTDCNDLDATIHPHAPEILGDGIDNDCNGVIDDCVKKRFHGE